VIEDQGEFSPAFATDIVTRIKQALDEGRKLLAFFQFGPMPQYPIAARMINSLRIPMKHVHTFNMDEYADQDGNTLLLTGLARFRKQ
jgi:glucosamine-6-phosphate deaminase